jgi:putative peptidoglycan lipid II flippase
MLPIGAVLGVGLGPLVGAAFNFGAEGTATMMWATRGFMAGLLGHSLMEVASRAFYARRDARTPLITGAINLVGYVILGLLLYRPLGPAGISLTDAICFSGQAVLLLVLLSRRLGRAFRPGRVLLRAVLAALVSGGATWLVLALPAAQVQPLMFGMLGLGLGALVMLPFVWGEVKLLFKL